MMTLEELHAHYKAVRARLDGPRTPKLTVVQAAPPEPEPEPVKPLPEEIVKIVSNITETPTQRILREVAEKYKMTVPELKSDSRMKIYVSARQEAAYRLKMELDFSLNQIGRVLGRRDHTTILHAINRYKKNLAKSGEPWARKCVSDECEEKT